MTIGFDARKMLHNRTGLGNYARTLVSDIAAIAPDERLLLFSTDKGDDALRHSMEGARTGFVYPSSPHFPFYKAWWRYRGIVSDIRRQGIDIYHGLTGELPFGISASGIPSIVTTHDLIFLRHPEWYHRIDARIYATRFFYTMREATHVIAISECTKRDIMEFGGVPENKISVVYQSCKSHFAAPVTEALAKSVKERYGLPETFVLFVGTIEERKNAMEIVEALTYMPVVSAVLVGRRTAYTDQVSERAVKLGVSDRLLMLHGVSDDDLHALYHLAAAFCYPSRYEGFGIPIIEAMEAGLPVVAATGSCLEEAGGPDSLYVSPDDPKAFAEATKRMLPGGDKRQEAIEKGKEYVKRFDGKKVAAQVLQLYHDITKA